MAGLLAVSFSTVINLREFRFLGPFLRPYWARYGLGAICVVASVAIKVLIPRVLGESIDVLGQGELSDPELRGVIANRAIFVVGLALGVALMRTSSRILILGTCRRIVRDLRSQTFAQFLRLDPDFYVRTPTGGLMSRAINDMNNVQGLAGPVFMYIAETVSLYVACLSFMLGVDSQLTLLGLLPFPFFLVLTRRLAGKIQRNYRQAQQKLSEVSSKVVESLSGQEVVKTLVLEDLDRRQFEGHADQYRGLNLSIARARALLMPTMLMLSALSTFIALAVGGPRVVRGELQLGELLAMILYFQMLAGPTRTLGFVISSLQRGTAALGRIREIFEMPSALPAEVITKDSPLLDEHRLQEQGQSQGAVSERKPVGVTVRNLTVDFPALSSLPSLSADTFAIRKDSEPETLLSSEGRRVLEDVSFDLPAGQTLGVVGTIGSGKTTLLRALARLLQVQNGQVFFDGADVNELELGEVRSRVGYVPQETFLFSETLSQNVAFGNRSAGDSEVEHVAELAQLAKDLPQIPGGYQAVLGERGVNLSGGQRQRTALARALLVDPDLLLLDDALSAVDASTALEILRGIRNSRTERSTVIAAHRLSTLQHADHILVLEAGRVVERGNHGELLQQKGLYARIYEEQQEEERSGESSEDGGRPVAEEVKRS